MKIDTLDQWEAECREYVRRVRLTEPKWTGLESRMLDLIDLVRKKDEALQRMDSFDRGLEKEYLKDRLEVRQAIVEAYRKEARQALALTEELK